MGPCFPLPLSGSRYRQRYILKYYERFTTNGKYLQITGKLFENGRIEEEMSHMNICHR